MARTSTLSSLPFLALGEHGRVGGGEHPHRRLCGVRGPNWSRWPTPRWVARTTMAEGELEQPRADVWDRIHEELSLCAAVAADPLAASQDRAGTQRRLHRFVHRRP